MSPGLSTAGRILLLVGAVVSLMFAVAMGAWAYLLGNAVLLVMAPLLALGAVCGFVAWRQAAAGRPGRAFGFGLAAALLPPVQVVPLVGAILVKVAQGQAPPAPA